MAAELEPISTLPASLERCRHVPDDRRSLCRGTTVLHPQSHRLTRCLPVGLAHIRVLPSHAIELAAVYLDRNLERIFAGPATAKPSAEHKGELASMIHLCGAAAAKAFAQRGFRLVTGERCGEHDVANYLARVKATEREFLRLAASQ